MFHAFVRPLPIFLAALLGGTTLLGRSSSLAAAQPDAPRRPNIVLIMSDDMGFSDLGCYGGEIHTPNLDALAADGLRFTQFYNCARCCPTRASLLTGLYPHQAAVGHMMGDLGYDSYRGDLSPHSVTIAEVLHAAGYRTYMVGKWHVTRFAGPDGPKHNWPLQRGFEKFYGTITGAGSYYDPTTLCRGNTFITPQNDPEYKPERFYYTEAISDNAVAFINQHYQESPGKPFFLYVAYTAAHWPMHALEKDIAKYRGKYDQGYGYYRRRRFERLKQMGLINSHWELSPQAGDWQKVKHPEWEARCMEVYAAMVDNMDQGIGRIVETLKSHQALINQRWVGAIKDRTPMAPDELQPKIWPPMKTRDGRPVRGGPEVMPGPEDTYISYGLNWANVSNTPFRGYKHLVHEGGIATPLIVHWPARIEQGGKLCHQPGHLIDIMATCVDVAGAEYPAEYRGRKIIPMEGRSLVPAFEDKPIQREAIYWEHEGNRAVRQGKWKLVSRHGGPWELYDMDADRTEMHDLAAKFPEKVEQLKALYQAWARRCGVQPWPVRRRP